MTARNAAAVLALAALALGGGGCSSMGASARGASASGGATATTRADVSFLAADRNHDGRISPREFELWQGAAADAGSRDAFDSADTSADGVLTLDEWQAMATVSRAAAGRSRAAAGASRAPAAGSAPSLGLPPAAQSPLR